MKAHIPTPPPQPSNNPWAHNQHSTAVKFSPQKRGAGGTKFKLAGKSVVIAEDQGMTQLQLRKILQAEGLNVVAMASNGIEAVNMVLKHKPDIVLMDVRMPQMDGLEASRQILATMKVCIVILTAFSDEEYQQEAMEMGICSYVLKPVSSQTLMPRLAYAFEQYNLKRTKH